MFDGAAGQVDLFPGAGSVDVFQLVSDSRASPRRFHRSLPAGPDLNVARRSQVDIAGRSRGSSAAGTALGFGRWLSDAALVVDHLDTNEVEGVGVESGEFLQVGPLDGVVGSDPTDLLPDGGVGVSDLDDVPLDSSLRICHPGPLDIQSIRTIGSDRGNSAHNGDDEGVGGVAGPDLPSKSSLGSSGNGDVVGCLGVELVEEVGEGGVVDEEVPLLVVDVVQRDNRDPVLDDVSLRVNRRDPPDVQMVVALVNQVDGAWSIRQHLEGVGNDDRRPGTV